MSRRMNCAIEPGNERRMTQAIAHRGEPVGHVENTEAAIRAAVDAGAGMVEIDVRLTADRTPVLLHDADLRRIWGVEADLAALTADQVAQLRGPAGERIPTLAEVAGLAADSGVQLMVDLPAEDAGPVSYDLLTSAGIVDACLFAGFTGPLRQHAPKARIALTWKEMHLPDEATLEFFRPEYFNPHFQLLTAGVADQMHERGILISVWTVDHPRDMAAVIVQGADAVISNRIAELITVIGEQP
jgi:glycerophosphoryl diester phosphodiesterase